MRRLPEQQTQQVSRLRKLAVSASRRGAAGHRQAVDVPARRRRPLRDPARTRRTLPRICGRARVATGPARFVTVRGPTG